MSKRLYLMLDKSSGEIRDARGHTYTADQARELWAAGRLWNYNTAFMRLIGDHFDLTATMAYYARVRAAVHQASLN